MVPIPAAFPPPPAGLAGIIAWLVQAMVWYVGQGEAASGAPDDAGDNATIPMRTLITGIWALNATGGEVVGPASGHAMPPRAWLREMARLHRDAWLIRECGVARHCPAPRHFLSGGADLQISRPFSTAGPFKIAGLDTQTPLVHFVTYT
jgi:hypothetical protein